jgi:hypothetical protein
VTGPTTHQVLSSIGFSCTGLIPGGGVNCFAGNGNQAASTAPIEGQPDTSTPFCSTLPAHPKPGTRPSPGARAELVVTGGTGAESGPRPPPMTPTSKHLKPVPKPSRANHHTGHHGN